MCRDQNEPKQHRTTYINRMNKIPATTITVWRNEQKIDCTHNFRWFWFKWYCCCLFHWIHFFAVQQHACLTYIHISIQYVGRVLCQIISLYLYYATCLGLYMNKMFLVLFTLYNCILRQYVICSSKVIRAIHLLNLGELPNRLRYTFFCAVLPTFVINTFESRDTDFGIKHIFFVLYNICTEQINELFRRESRLCSSRAKQNVRFIVLATKRKYVCGSNLLSDGKKDMKFSVGR